MRYDEGDATCSSSRCRARLDDGLFSKLIAPGWTSPDVDVDGVPAYWITGQPHVFMYVDARR